MGSCDRFAMLSASQKHDPLTASLRPTWRSPLSDDHVRSQDVGVVAAIVGRKRESSPGTHRDTCRLLALKRTSATCSSREASAVALERSAGFLNCTRSEAQREEHPDTTTPTMSSTTGMDKTFHRLNAALARPSSASPWSSGAEAQVPRVFGRSEWQTSRRGRSRERFEADDSWTTANV